MRQVNYIYDQGTGNVLQELGLICSTGSCRSNSYGYDSYNNRKAETNAADIVTQYSYDSTSETFPVQLIKGGSYTTSSTFDPRSGKIYITTNEAGLVVSNRYDAFLRLAEKYCSTTQNGSPGEWLDQYTYTLGNSSGPQNSVLHQQSDEVDFSNGHETMTWFDGLGRLIQSRTEAETGQYRASDTAYDARGNVEFVSLPYFASGTSRSAAVTGLGTLHGYDQIGRPNQVTASVTGTFSSGVLTSTSASGGDSGSQIGTATVTYYYSSDPWTWVVTDESTNTHRYTRDAYGRTNQIVEINGSQNYTTSLNWNLASDLLSITDNVGNVIQYSNNLVGDVVAMADPDVGVWLYDRDYAGRIRLQTDGDGQTIQYNYSPDPLGRLLSRQVYDLKGNFYYGVTNVYDTNSGDTGFPTYKGQLYETVDSEGFTEFGYDVRGRKTITRRFLAKNGNFYTNQYSYDDMDRVRSIVYPNGGPQITNAYDYGANLSVVQQVGGAGTTFYHATSFSSLDQISNIAYANNTFSSTYNYYPKSKRLEAATTSGSLQNLTYTYDAVADVLSISDSQYSGAASAGISSVSYDSLHRLTGFTRNSQSVTFTYDTIGNMLTDTENGSTSYVYTTPAGTRLPHAVKSANGLNYAYDLCGNMLVRGTEALMYNPENRLIALAVSNQVTTFGYDADGNRLWKQGAPTNTLQVWIEGDYEEKDGKILYHIPAGRRLVYTYSSDSTIQEYYVPDHLHSAEIMATPSGGLYQHYEYTAYGNSRYESSMTAFPITSRYTGQSFDEETGLYYYGNSRYYDPVIGRFIQPDTLIPNFYDPQTYDRYAYARDNPLFYVDPTGHGPVDVAGDALFNTGTFKSSYQLLTMRDSTGWKIAEVPVALGGMAVATADSAFNILTLGGKGAVEGGVKEAVKVGVEEIGKEGTQALKAGVEGTASATGRAASQIDRTAFAKERSAFWKREAAENPSKYSEENLARMEEGKAPVGEDGHPMELHHVDRTPEGGLKPMTRTEHRLGENYKKNHPPTSEKPSGEAQTSEQTQQQSSETQTAPVVNDQQ